MFILVVGGYITNKKGSIRGALTACAVAPAMATQMTLWMATLPRLVNLKDGEIYYAAIAPASR